MLILVELKFYLDAGIKFYNSVTFLNTYPVKVANNDYSYNGEMYCLGWHFTETWDIWWREEEIV